MAMAAKDKKAATSEKLIATNRKAHFEYFLSDYLEAGISLTGTEIKSLRQGHCSLADSYVMFRNGEAFICGMDISPYERGNIFNHEPKADRKLLLHKSEIRKYAEQVQVKGYTVVPVRCYLKRGKAKIEIALAKGKNEYDKRDTIKDRDAKRQIDREIKERNG
jgi:SsrA-binding protein